MVACMLILSARINMQIFSVQFGCKSGCVIYLNFMNFIKD